LARRRAEHGAIAAVCETPAGLRAVVSTNALGDRAAFTQTPSPTDYEGETAEARLARRAARWMSAAVHR